MGWTSMFDLIDRKQPDRGYWVGTLRCLTALWHERLSLGSAVKRRALPRYVSEEPGKAKAWVAELYATSAFLLAVVAFLAASPLHHLSFATIALGLLTVVWPIYRALEILFLLLSWVFVDTSRLHSVQRSLLGFLLNIAEVSCLFGAVELSVGSKVTSGRGQMFVDGMVDLVTLSHHDPISFSVDGTLEAMRILFGVLLVLVVVGSLAGGVARRTLVDDAQPGAPGDGLATRGRA